jgi:hypothetical protein
MWIPEERNLLCYVNQRYSRLSASIDRFDGRAYRAMVRHLTERIDTAAKEIHRARQLDITRPEPKGLEDIVESLYPRDASCFRWAHVMSGISLNPHQRFSALREELIDRHERHVARERRNEESVWVGVERKLEDSGLLACIDREREIASAHYRYKFRAGWMNSVPQVLEPISLDLIEPNRMLDKAQLWSGRLYNLSRGAEFMFSGVVTGPPAEKFLREAWDASVEALREAPNVRMIAVEDDVDSLIQSIARDVQVRGLVS